MSEQPDGKKIAVRKQRAPEVTPPPAPVAEGPGALAATLLNVVAEAARDPNCDASKMEQLVRLQQNILAWEAERTYDEAYAAMWAKLPQIERLGDVNTGKGSYKFAKMEDLDKEIRPLLAEYGFWIQHRTISEDVNSIHVIGTLGHRSGHKVSSEMIVPPDMGPGRNGLQAIGSAKTYAERYITEGLLNLVRKGADDDGRGYRTQTDSTTRTVERLTPPSTKPVAKKYATDPNSWLGKAERKLDEVAENGYLWLKVLQYACKTASNPDDLTALEGMTREALKGAPDDVRVDSSAAFLTAKLRLSNEQLVKGQGEQALDARTNTAKDQASAKGTQVDAAGEVYDNNPQAAASCPACNGRGHIVAMVDYGGKAKHKSGPTKLDCQTCGGTGLVRQEHERISPGDGEVFRVIDPFGEILDEYMQPLAFARRLIDEWQKWPDGSDESGQIIEHNEADIDRAKTDPAAAELLSMLEDPLPKDQDVAWADEAITKFRATMTRASFNKILEWSKPTMLRLKKAKPDLFNKVDAVVAERHQALPQ